MGSKKVIVKEINPAKFNVVSILKSIDTEQRRDIVALLVMVFCLLLIAMGYDSYISATLMGTAGYYFGRRNAWSKKE